MAAKVLSCGLLIMLAGCASTPPADEAFVQQLVTQLAGSYDNLAQSRASPEHPALRLVVAPVQAPIVGDHVFYVQEMAADDARRVLAQHLLVLNPVPGREQALLTQADFAEPLRWRDGHANRDLFRSLLPQDLRLRPGCDLLVTRKDAGFTGATGAGCRGSASATGEAVKVDQRITVDVDGVALFEQQRDAAGQLVRGGEADPWYRFARRADAW
jgi:hypothetical protein